MGVQSYKCVGGVLEGVIGGDSRLGLWVAGEVTVGPFGDVGSFTGGGGGGVIEVWEGRWEGRWEGVRGDVSSFSGGG